ncbi:cation:proton antiporter [Deinococcus radiophilus]|uniref:Sodium:proton antiporter n=2 Tax=Deinococcus radiophilus TaxID=32062 RepID=A0A431W358_9DEIO|nr:sodium:proton antiporter [Deinococcus radiophilus]RTR29854.1 sodium:proton antiporter [Deinococcus radiophilus]
MDVDFAHALDHAVVVLPIIVALGLAAQILASRLKIPAILPLLLTGFLVGPLLHVISPGTALTQTGLSTLTSLAVAVILFEGGLTLRFKDIAGHGLAVTRLISVGALVTWVLAAAGAHFITGLDWGVAALFGALVIVTGPTVIAPLLQNIRPNARVSGVLRWEGILIDPIGVLAAAIAFEWVRSSSGNEALTATLTQMATFIGVGTIFGVVMGLAMIWALRREIIPDHLVNPAVLAWVLLAFGLTDIFVPESGLLAVTIMGMMAANMNVPRLNELLHFKEEVVVILLSTIFVALAANIPTSALLGVFQPAPLLLLAFMILIVRPISVMISTAGSNLNLKERAFISYIGPRGIVAAAVSALFASRLTELGVPGGEQLLTLVFAVIVGTVILVSLTAKPVARALGVAQADPDGFLVVGAHLWARELALALKNEGVDVLVADTNPANIAQARMEGLGGHYGSLLSEAADRIPMEGIGNLLALTPNDEANTLTTRKYEKSFGRAHVFQLYPGGENRRTQINDNYSAQSAFSGTPTFSELQKMFAEGAKLRRTRLTDEYTLEHYRTELPENALLLFYGREGRMQVATGLPDTAQAGTVLIALVPPPGAPDTVPGSHSPEQPQPVSPQEATTNVAEPEQMDTGR